MATPDYTETGFGDVWGDKEFSVDSVLLSGTLLEELYHRSLINQRHCWGYLICVGIKLCDFISPDH